VRILVSAIVSTVACAVVGDGAAASTFGTVTHGPSWDQPAYAATVNAVAAHHPRFPPRQCNILAPRYAGLVRTVTDGESPVVQRSVWYYGDAINVAIADCHRAGGGTVVIPAGGSRNADGAYYSGAITLLSNVDLEVETGATIKFVRNPSNTFYPVVLTSYQGIDFYDYSPLVYALNQTNIALTGGGTLDAQDNVSSWQLPTGSSSNVGTWQVLSQMNDAGVPVDQRIFTDDGQLPARIPVPTGCPPQQLDWGPCAAIKDTAPPAGTTAYRSTFLPQFVEFNHSSNALVEGIHLVNTQFWQIHPLNSEYVTVAGAIIYDTAHHTDDGIDPESSRDVVIRDDDITVLDDGIAVKSGRNSDGRDLRAPSEDVVIENDHFTNPAGGGSAAFSVGSEMSGGVRNVFAQNDVADGDGLAYLLKLKTNSYRGGAIQDIYVRNSTLEQTIRGVVNIDTNYSESPAQTDGDEFNPTIEGIYLDHVDSAPALRTTYPPFNGDVTQSRSPVEDVVYENSVFNTTSPLEASFAQPGSQFFAGLRIANVTLTNPATGANVTYNSQPLGLADDTVAHVSGDDVHLVAQDDCQTCGVNHLPSPTFTVTGRVANYQTLTPTVQVFLDRDRTPINVTVDPDGSFTTAPITLDNNQYWYRGRHYLSINLHTGIDIDSTVYELTS
jgi:polygalacturonase